MTPGDLLVWLASVTPTHPFTNADARELHAMIKNAAPSALVDVYTTKGDKVHVRVNDLYCDLDVVG